jgi:alkane 1-monooxygenase
MTFLTPPVIRAKSFFNKQRVKKYGYLIIFLLAALPVFSFWLIKITSFPNLFSYFLLAFVFVVVPILDLLIGKDEFNPDENLEVPNLENDKYYRLLTILCMPIYFFILSFSMWVFVSVELSILGKIGWVTSIGVFGSVFAINAAHELMHKNNKVEQFISGILLSLVCFSSFKIEHIRGHHVYVSTPHDHSSATFNQSLYNFLQKALSYNFVFAFQLEKNRLQKKGLGIFHWQNELLWWYLLSIFWLSCALIAFGILGAIFFLATSFIAVVLLEIINYVEHYGLERKLKKNNKYEPVTHRHSWNSSFLFTNLLLFQLQRHSDHHAYPKRRYQSLRHHDDSPQLPFGYATMVVIALCPPLWRTIMNPRVKEYLKNSTQ